jgi:phosphoglucosamine mutase
MGRLFGTDGLRGVAGQFPLDNATVELLGHVLYFLLTDRKLQPEIIVGRDTRESGPFLFDALARGFAKAGGQIYDAGVLSTPALAYLATAEKKCAISITASHNPYPDNGIKIFGADGFKLSEEAEGEIEPYLLGEKAFLRNNASADHPAPQPMHDTYLTQYCRYFLDRLFRGLDLSGMKIAVDCANGALSEIAPKVLSAFGARVVAFHTNPNGRNINEGCGSLHPEILLEEIRRDGFDCGFTFDGDGDRCLAGDRKSVYDGDFILGAAAIYLHERGELKKDAVVATSMSNLGLEIFLKKHAIHLHRVPVGDKNVLEKLRQEDLSLGGEQSGHIIFMNESFIGDGLLTALELLRIYKNSAAPFSDLCDGFVKCPQILLNVPVRKKPELETLPEIQASIRKIEQELGDAGRILVRYSGTEMKARIMIEGTDQNRIETLAGGLAEIIKNKLN